MSNRLQGPLYFLSFGAAAIVASIGLSCILYGPFAANFIFGIPITTISSILPVSQDRTAAHAFVAVIGVRDCTLAFCTFCAALLRDQRAVGLVMAGGIFATVGDSIVMATYSKSPAFWIGAHLATGLPLFWFCYVLLAGGPQAQKLKR